MPEFVTIKAPESAVEAAREAKRDDETWGEYLLRCADADVPRKWTAAEIDGRIERKLGDAFREATRREYR